MMNMIDDAVFTIDIVHIFFQVWHVVKRRRFSLSLVFPFADFSRTKQEKLGGIRADWYHRSSGTGGFDECFMTDRIH